MIFGLGRKKQNARMDATADGAADGAASSLSTEAMDMVRDAVSGMSAAGPVMAPVMAPAMPAGVATPPGSVMPDTADAPAAAKKKTKKPLTRDEKKAAATAKNEARLQEKRRKKASKTRFSRTRYMREANGNAAAGLSLSVFLLVATIIGPVVLNVMVLMPQTSANQEVVREVEKYKEILTRSQPLLQAAVSNKAQREQAIEGRLAAFRDAEVVTSQLRKFVSDLEAAGAEITDEASRTVVNSNLGVSGLVGKTVTIKMRSDFLRYLLVRNKFVRAQSSVTVSNETVTSVIGDPVMMIEVTMIVPARS